MIICQSLSHSGRFRALRTVTQAGTTKFNCHLMSSTERANNFPGPGAVIPSASTVTVTALYDY